MRIDPRKARARPAAVDVRFDGKVKVMTLNVHKLVPASLPRKEGADSTESKKALRDTIAFIKRQNPDVLVLQELDNDVSGRQAAHGVPRQLEQLARGVDATGSGMASWTRMPGGNGYDNAVITRNGFRLDDVQSQRVAVEECCTGRRPGFRPGPFALGRSIGHLLLGERGRRYELFARRWAHGDSGASDRPVRLSLDENAQPTPVIRNPLMVCLLPRSGRHLECVLFQAVRGGAHRQPRWRVLDLRVDAHASTLGPPERIRQTRSAIATAPVGLSEVVLVQFERGGRGADHLASWRATHQEGHEDATQKCPTGVHTRTTGAHGRCRISSLTSPVSGPCSPCSPLAEEHQGDQRRQEVRHHRRSRRVVLREPLAHEEAQDARRSEEGAEHGQAPLSQQHRRQHARR